MTNNPLLSIIIAAHNCEKTIDATFQSLLDALGPSLAQAEIIIINDASEDRTGEKIAHYAISYPQVIISSVTFKNIGRVRQHGISLSQGEYITMLDSDDLMKKETLPQIIDFLRETRPDMLLTRLHEIRDLNKIDHQWSGLYPEKLSRKDTITRFLIHKDLQAHLIGQFIKKEIYLHHKIPAMACYEDFYVFPQMLMDASSIYFQYDSHYYYIKHQGSLSSTPDEDKIANLIDCTLKMEEVLPNDFHHLVLCHWLDIFIKHKALLNDKHQKDIVKKHVIMTHSPGFFLNSTVRFSYKRKALSTLWKN
ncbi:glycosyltransferase [Enterobacteriaceae bacterium H20N1]|uniref:Glycosyltransferase n=1 Tax=Dryocola boscaweniae TaxID=2925397 RepID=A0A9X2W7P9_9ENTR|nr:glycosyltransferase family 2 protein [Dryocola boscaweniae]MCT4700814.1 glycosyltransferase [Dryocola boscaweniae]MCT4717981.1 glycosyltransferase [Dryocola boscaweniae]